MGRHGLTLVVVGVVALAAAAQGPAPGKSAAEQLRLFQRHRPLLGQLLDRALDLAVAGDPLDRADRSHAAATALSAALTAEGTGPDADPSRVAELAELLASVVRDGYGKSLAEAIEVHQPGSDGYRRLVDLRRTAAADYARVRSAAFPGDGPAARSPQVRAARGAVDAAVDGLPRPPAGE